MYPLSNLRNTIFFLCHSVHLMSLQSGWLNWFGRRAKRGSELIRQPQRSEVILEFFFPIFPKHLLWHWEIREFVSDLEGVRSQLWSLSWIKSFRSMVDLNLGIKNQKDFKNSDSWFQSQRFPDFRALHLGNTKALESHTFRTRTRMGLSSGNEA